MVFRLIVVPIAVRMGIPNKKKRPLDSNKALEQAFLTSRNPDEKMLKVGFDFLSGFKIILPAFFFRKKVYINFVSKSVRPSVRAFIRHISCKCIST